MIWLRVASCSWQAEACDASQCAQAAGSCPDDILMGRLAKDLEAVPVPVPRLRRSMMPADQAQG